ncbi:MAG TPA: S24 family peptidase [Phycisphaerae bacterium]|nr:S24 family peptidase [Phycisphaerae bacterium]
MGIGEILRQRREQLGMTQDQVAARADISKPYLSNIETGKANAPTDTVLDALERALGFEQGQLLRLAHLARTPRDIRQEREMLQAEVAKLRGVLKELMAGPRAADGSLDLDAVARSLDEPSNITRITAGVAVPVINNVQAGYPQHFTDLDYPPSVADEYVRVADLHDPQAFAARVVGESMEPAYHEGDTVVFSPNLSPRGGDDCFVRFEDGETTFKRFYQDDPEAIRLQPLNPQFPARSYPCEQVTGLWPAVYRIERLR